MSNSKSFLAGYNRGKQEAEENSGYKKLLLSIYEYCKRNQDATGLRIMSMIEPVIKAGA